MPEDASETTRESAGTRRSPRSVLRAVGSLWFAAVLLILWAVAMACATVFESTHGTDRALITFYASRWFECLLVLIGINVAAAVAARWPFSRKQFGFVVTHGSILVIFGGALITRHYGIDGQIAVEEGQTVSTFASRNQETVRLAVVESPGHAIVDLDEAISESFAVIESPTVPPLILDDIQANIVRYVPDSDPALQVTNDNPRPQLAVEVTFPESDDSTSTWVFAGHTAMLGPATAAVRSVPDDNTLRRLLANPPTTQPDNAGTVRIEYEETTFEYPLDECLAGPVRIGDSGFTAHVLRYVPDFHIRPDRTIVSRSELPNNPAIQVELTGPDGRERRWAFARFPNLGDMHGKTQAESLRVTFVQSTAAALPTAEIEILIGPADAMHVRFAPSDGPIESRSLAIGTPVETPWSNRTFVAHRRFDHARASWSAKPVEPVRRDRTPALLLRLTAGDETRELWLQKYQPNATIVSDNRIELHYGNKTHPLGFALTLDRFHIGTYPGTGRPRSFESHITIQDPTTQQQHSHVISMNHPATHGGYSLFQSSYNKDRDRTSSVLSVSRDPGQPIVFAGYVFAIVGMTWVLVQRFRDQRSAAGEPGRPSPQ